jgi:hypothetical protein
MIHHLPHGEIHLARVEAVYPLIASGSVTLSIIDGPYGMNKAAWDKVPDLAAFYAPHIAEVSRVSAPSAGVYLWNTTEGWAAIHPVMVAAGWTFRALVTWDKGIGFLAGKIDTEGCRTWPDVTEVCGFYQRNAWDIDTSAGQMIGYAAGADERNWIREWLAAEWAEAGLRNRDADQALGTNGMAGHYFGRSQWSLPTWENYQRLAACAVERGPARERPYLVHPSVWPIGGLRASYDHLRASYDHLRASYDHLRAEYEAARCPFTLPNGVTNVWSGGQVQGAERLRAGDGSTLHPCQKPLAFAERMILASSRPGDLVFAPFGGTCREAVAIEMMARREPEMARRYVTAEMDEDGRDYLGAVLAQIRGPELGGMGQAGQTRLFARGVA